MIAVIADDFTGAAELAGISLRYGLKVKLYTGPAFYEDCDVCIISSNSRSMPKAEAIDTTRKIILALQERPPSFIYKKIDSVLRGYVLDELKVQMQLTQKARTMIVPANPSLARKIIDGKYYIHNELIERTDFFNDPEFPVKTSDVRQMLGDRDNEVALQHRPNNDPDKAIVVAETASVADIRYLADNLDNDWLLAGAGDFFESILSVRFSSTEKKSLQLTRPHLYVCGTTAAASRLFISHVEKSGGSMLYLNDEHLSMPSPGFSTDRLNAICKNVDQRGSLLLAIAGVSKLSAPQVRQAVAALVDQLCGAIHFREIFIEGGSTAASILDRLDLRSFLVTNELQRGVVRMQSGQFFITVKPGSYIIPEQIRDLYLIKANQ